MNKSTHFLISLLTVFGMIFAPNLLLAQSNDDCLTCHSDKSLSKVRNGKTVSLYINDKILLKSVHKKVACASCHKDAAVADFPHPENLKPVNCGTCHGGEQKQFFAGIHGQALKSHAEFAPDCKECHGEHDILSRTNPESRTYKMNVPLLCGKCHREGAPVARNYNISEHNILENYSESIHGRGLYERGLIVTATCNDCHGNHMILPHTNSLSSTSVKNIANTCMQCHARIESVHKKVIKMELWEKSPGAIPACTDCHRPHMVDVKNVTVNIADKACLDCHSKDDVHKTVNGKSVSLKIDPMDFKNTVHPNIPCVKCHTDVQPLLKRPCQTAGKVDCSNCHVEVANQYFASGHGQAFFKKDMNAPYCTDCHGTHIIKSAKDETSKTFRSAVPDLCGNCHRTGGQALKSAKLHETNAIMDYSQSVHGKGLKEKGLLSAAICTDCHTTHFILKENDERSSVFKQNIPGTCGKCHKGIYDEFKKSDHAFNPETGKNYPTCADCHSAHKITETDKDKFMSQITNQCGLCHKDLAATYLETYHGKAYKLGYLKAAKCSDCHTAHSIYAMNNPNSSVGVRNIVATCKKCHADANSGFTGYLTHATHYNRSKFPILYYTFWAMTLLLVSVFGFFGLHTLLWLPRSIRERRKRKHAAPVGKTKYFRRFSKSQRWTHIFVIISFLLLAMTGMTLKFAEMPWAKFIADLFGGAHNAGKIHRFAAVITFGYFAFHVFSLLKMKFNRKVKISKFIFGSYSLMFNRQDLRDFWATLKWFVGKGPRPSYGRWTYWEKFDYMAVFWGVAVIGFSGLMLWFPETFGSVFPGWFVNVAQIIHSDEALLAVGFIFTIHFFNTHFRPEAFPMDTVIFTGHVPMDEFIKDRPREYEELEKSGKLEKFVVEREFSDTRMKTIRTFGFIFLTVGVSLVMLILYSLLFGK